MSNADRVVQCPTCGKSLEIAEAAPRVVTCPKCLVAFANPLPDTDVKRVIPLDYQVRADSTSSTTTIFVLICLIVVGTLLPVAAYGVVSQNGSLIGVAVLFLLILYVFTGLAAGESQQASESHPTSRPVSTISKELAIFRFFVGLFGGIAISVIFWLFNTDWVGPLTLFLVPAMKFCIAFALLFLPRWRTCSAGLFLSIFGGALIFIGGAVYGILTTCKPI